MTYLFEGLLAIGERVGKVEVDDTDHLHAGVAGRHPRHGVARAAAAADAAAVGGRAAAAPAIPAAAGPVMGKYVVSLIV